MMSNTTYTGPWTATKVRQQFFDYFSSKGHTFVPSSSTIPYDDPSLLFANAGMNQYKAIFLGTVDPQSQMARLRRAHNSQKCIRAGGKHNDLEDVGKDSYHHTFFEMLGNWSFGDYFKKEAIEYAWELLTEVYKLPKDRLYVTYFEGDAENGLEADSEARRIWLDQGLAEDHIITGNAKDNFWGLFDCDISTNSLMYLRDGSYGPLWAMQRFISEVHFDRIGGRNAAHLVNKDDADVLEIWNNVFIQFNREDDGSLKPLPAQHVDNGMGFERLLSILQGKRSNYDTDIFAPLFDKVHELTGVRPYAGKFGEQDTDGIDTAYRVVADHVRTLTFALSDGGVPNNVGRGYVLRRILRRGARYARKRLGVSIGSFFSSLMPVLVENMGSTFPELLRNVDRVKEILDEEEESFSRTLDRGEKLFEQYAKRAKESGAKELKGKDVWRLYDTYGFPDDLTRLMAEEIGLGINDREFDEAQALSKEASKSITKKGASELVKLDVHDVAALDKNDVVPKTDDSAKFDLGNISAQVKAIFHEKCFSDSTVRIPQGSLFGIILDRTNFYAEAGGQEHDTGSIVIDNASNGEVAEFEVSNVQAFSGYILHIGKLKSGKFEVGDQVISTYDEPRRWPIRNNHTATHILNFCLRESLGDHIDQKGSLVAPSKLRFDFSHKAQIPSTKLAVIESMSVDWIRKNVKVYGKDLYLEVARKIPGVRAVFGEVYPDPVRVVSLGYDIGDVAHDLSNQKWMNTSIEFCGGTHVARTGDIKDFVIIEESGIAKGIRRIVALTGHEAQEARRIAASLKTRLDQIDQMTGRKRDTALKDYTMELGQSVISVIQKAELRDRSSTMRKIFDKQVKEKEASTIRDAQEKLQQHFKENDKSDVFVAILDVDGSAKILMSVVSQAKKLGKAAYVFSTDQEGGKVAHANFVPDTLRAQGLDARDWASRVAEIVGGKAGGREDSAQGVGDHIDKVNQAVQAANEYYSSVIR